MKNNLDLGKYDLNKMLRSPALIHKIQDALRKIGAFGMGVEVSPLSIAIVAYRETAIDPLIKILYNEPDRNKVVELIGKETMDWICEYMGESVDDLRDLNIFTKS